MDSLLKEGYNIFKHSSRYGVDELASKKHEELLAESLARYFLGEKNRVFQCLIERLENDAEI